MFHYVTSMIVKIRKMEMHEIISTPLPTDFLFMVDMFDNNDEEVHMVDELDTAKHFKMMSLNYDHTTSCRSCTKQISG